MTFHQEKGWKSSEWLWKWFSRTFVKGSSHRNSKWWAAHSNFEDAKKTKESAMKQIVKKLIIVSGIILFCSGCSVFMAAKQPDAKDTKLFKVGTPRSMLLAEFGLPIAAEVRDDGKKYEIFAFTQGYSTGAKAGRAVFHGAADVMTLGLWEVIGTPTEGAFDGDEVAYEVRYDQNSAIDQVVALKKK